MKKRNVFLTMTMVAICVGLSACGSADSSKETKANTTIANGSIIETEEAKNENTSVVETEKNEETEEITTELVIDDSDLEYDESGIYGRNQKLEKVIYDYYKDDTTCVIQYSEVKQEYRYFTPEQLASFDELCEKWVSGEVTQPEISGKLEKVYIQNPDGSFKKIYSKNFTEFTFDGKNISMEELEKLLRKNGGGWAKIPNYLFVRVIYDKEWDETKVYCVLAEGTWN